MINYSPEQAVMVGSDLSEWHTAMEGHMDRGALIIALRGAGKVYGIEPAAALQAGCAIEERVTRALAADIPVVLMYDGDEDRRELPDIGAVFGTVADSLSLYSLFLPVAVQTASRHMRQTEGQGGPLVSARGTPYATYVFPDDVPGGHASLTQSAQLVQYPTYEQTYVGPIGPAGMSQLEDLATKIQSRPDMWFGYGVRVINTPNHPAVEEMLQEQFAAAVDPAIMDKIRTQLERRTARPFGELCTREGVFSPPQYENLYFEPRRIGM